MRGKEFESPDELGATALLGTLASRACGAHDRSSFARACDERGANVSVYTGDTFTVEFSVLPEDLEWAIATLGDMALRPRLDLSDVESAREEHCAQIEARLDEPRLALTDRVRQQVFADGHCYQTSPEARLASGRALSVEKMEDFHRRLLLTDAPLAVSLTGAFDPECALAAIEKLLSPISPQCSSRSLPKSGPSIYRDQPERCLKLPFPIEQNRVMIGIPGLSRFDASFFQASFANELFGGAFLSRLTRAVRSSEGLAYSAGSRLWSGFSGGLLWIGLQTDHQNLAKALLTVRCCMEDLLSAGVPAEELSSFREFVISSLPFEYDSISSLSDRRIEEVFFQEPWLPEKRTALLKSLLTAEATQEQFQRLLRPELAVVAIAGKEPGEGVFEAFFEEPSKTQVSQFSATPLPRYPSPNPPVEQPPQAERLAEHANGTLFRFSSGLHLLSLPRPEIQSISLQVWSLVGSMDELPGESGISHMLEHLMFRGTESHPDGHFDGVLTQKGGLNNAFTSEDFTIYTDYLVADGLEEALLLEADRFQNLVFTEDVFQTERDVVLEERSLRVDSNPLGKVYEELQSGALGDHPYASPVLGSRADLMELDTSKLRKHYEKTIEPANLMLVIAGDCSSGDAARMVARTWQKVAEKPPSRSARIPLLSPTSQVPNLVPLRFETEDRVGFSHAIYALRFPREGHPDYEVCELLSRLLGEGDSSFLHQRLVVEEETALEVWVSYDSQTRDHSLLYFGILCSDPISQEAMLDRIGALLEQFPQSLTPSDLSKAKRGWIAEAAFDSDELEDWALEIAGRVALLPWDQVWTRQERIEAVTLEQLRTACQEYLKPQGLAQAILHARP